MSLNTSYAQLHAALKTLRLHWEQTKLDWHDVVRREFEQQDWAALEIQVTSTLQAMDHLSQIMIQCKQDCA